jgi:hypothetical protein
MDVLFTFLFTRSSVAELFMRNDVDDPWLVRFLGRVGAGACEPAAESFLKSGVVPTADASTPQVIFTELCVGASCVQVELA